MCVAEAARVCFAFAFVGLTFTEITGVAVLVSCAVVMLILHHTPLGTLIHEHIPDRPRRRLLLASIGFFLTFGSIRALTWSIHHNIGPFHDIEIGGRHIHHLVWGILLVLAVGYGWLVEWGTGAADSSMEPLVSPKQPVHNPVMRFRSVASSSIKARTSNALHWTAATAQSASMPQDDLDEGTSRTTACFHSVNRRHHKRQSAHATVLIFLLLAFTAGALGARRFVMPHPSDAKVFPAHDEHPTEQVTIAIDPYDTEQKASIFSTRYMEHGLLPILFIVSNGRSNPVLLSGVNVQLVLSNRTKISPADEDDMYRHLTRTPRNDSSVPTLPLPVPRKPKAGVPRETKVELDVSRFQASTVDPGKTQSGFFFFDVSGIRASLAGAHLYVTGVRDSNGSELMFFDIPLDKYLASQPPAAGKP